MAIQLKNKSYTPVTPNVSLTAFTASGNMVMSGITIHEVSAGAIVRMYLYNAADASVTEIINVTTTSAGQQVLSAPMGMQVGDEVRVNVSKTGPTFVFSYALSTASLSGTALDALSDTNVPTPTTNDVLTWNGSLWVSSAPTGGGASAMDDLTDVIATSPSTGQVLSYNTGNWILDNSVNDLKTMLKKDVSSSILFNTLNDTTKGYLQLDTDGFTIGKNNSAIVMSENSPTITDFLVQDDGVTPAQITAMRVTNAVGLSNTPQVIVGGTTAVANNALTIIGDGHVSNDFRVNNDLTIVGNLNATLTTSNLDDFNVTGPAINQVLKWDGTDWTNQAEANAFSTIAVSGQSNVVADSDKDILTIAAGTGITLATDAGTDTLTITGTIESLGDLNNVTETTPANGQVLKYNGSAWVNAAENQESIQTLSDVALGGPASAGEVLYHDGSDWTNQTLAIGDITNLQTTLDAKSNHKDHSGVSGSTGSGATFFKDLASGQTLTAGKIYYYSASGWVEADASAAASATGMLGVCTTTTTGALMVEKGMVNPFGTMSGTIGQPVYLSETAGEVTLTTPTTSGAIARVVGYYVDSTNDVLFFNPSQDWIEIS